MQKFVFENNGTNTFLSYMVREEDEIDSMSLGMIINNNINGFAKSVFTQVDDKKYIKYNISAKVPARQFLAGIVSKKRLLGVFNGIVDAIISAEEYMIDVRSLILNLDYIFTDVSTCETCLICLPVISQESEEIDIRAFFKTTMFSTSFDQSENCDYVAQIINYLNSTTVFSLEDFKKVLIALSANNTKKNTAPSRQPVVTVTNPQPKTSQNIQQSEQRTNNQSVQQPHAGQKPVISSMMDNKQPSPIKTSSPNPPSSNQFEPAQNKPVSTGVQAEEREEEEISWFYLMQHYNKENAEKYKRQQAAKKQAKGQDKPQKEKKKDKKDKNTTPPAMPGFAIPGQEQSINQMSQQQLRQQATPQPIAQPQPQQPGYPPAPQISYPPIQQPVMQQPPIKGNFGETTVLGGAGGRIGETTVLNANTEAPQINPRLIRAKNNERININKPVFRIGKERSYVDYFIGDNPAISRSHANIVERDGEYFLVDTNSTNHTYINGGIIQPNTEVRLSHGAKVRFANEEFEFQLY